MAYVGRQPLAGEVIILDDIQSQFNGVLTTFDLTRTINGTTIDFYPVATQQLLVSLGGTIQEPDRTGTKGFKVDANRIVFASAPPASTDCFIVSYGNVTDLVDYKNFNPFKNISLSDSIYYYNPENLTISKSGTITDGTADNFFTLSKTVTLATGAEVTVGDGESLTVDLWDTTGYAGATNAYTLPTASTTTLGGVKVDGTSIQISSGTISVNQSNIDYNSISNTPNLSALNSFNVTGATTNDILTYNGSQFVADGTVTNLILNQAGGNFLAGGAANTVSNYRYNYANGTTNGLKIGGVGSEAGLDLVGNNDGDHAASILLRQENEGYAFVVNPNDDQLQLKTFTATADDFYVHQPTGGTTIENRLTLERTTGNVVIISTGFTSALSNSGLEVRGLNATNTFQSQLNVRSTDATGQNNGGSIALIGNDNSFPRVYATVRGLKESATITEWGGYLSLSTRRNGTVSMTEAVRIDSNQNVGIGTENPYHRLHINWTSTDLIADFPNSGTDANFGDSVGLRIENQTSGAYSLAHFRSDVADWLIGTRYTSSATGDFVFFHESDEILTLKPTFRVGIGNTDPDATIHVSSESSNSNPWAIFEVQDQYFKKIHFYESSNAYDLEQYGSYLGYDANSNNFQIGLYNAGVNNGIIKFNRDTTLFTIQGNYGSFCVDQNDSSSSTVRFGSYGNTDVGICTGRSTETGSTRIHIENGDGEAIRITDNNIVAIGVSNTVDPDTLSGTLINTGRHAIYHADKIGLIIYGNSPTVATPSSKPYVSIGNDGTTSYLIAGSGATGDVDLEIQTAVGGTETTKVWLDHDGQVGLGSSPSEFHRLNVYGDSTVSPSIQIRSTDDNIPPRLVFQPNISNLAGSCRIEFWEGFNNATYLNANACIEYDATTNYGGDGALLIKGYASAPLGSAADTVIASFGRNGAVNFAGSVSKGSGSFKINHPLPEKTDTHYLVHSFVEGPQADLIYRGRIELVNGTASVNIDLASGMTDGTFDVLCGDVQCFTSNETGWTAVRGSVSGNILSIEAQDPTCTDTISWMVVGERKDPHMIGTDWTDENGKVIVEPPKANSSILSPSQE